MNIELNGQLFRDVWDGTTSPARTGDLLIHNQAL